MNYKAYYGLAFDPFDKELDVKNSFASSDFKEALSRMEYLKTVKGIGLFTGDAGMGKTYAMRHFVSTLNPSLYKVIYLPISTLTVLEFYRALAYGLGIEPAHKKIDNFRGIQETIEYMSKEKRITPVFLLDEAQYLKTDVLNDLKILFNFHMDSKNYCIVLLTGQAILKNILTRNLHEPLKQRIVISYTFEGITKEETKNYIESRLALADVHTTIFSESAIEAIYSCCNGSIRKLNSLLTKCLIAGALQESMNISTDTVMRAQSEVELV